MQSIANNINNEDPTILKDCPKTVVGLIGISVSSPTMWTFPAYIPTFVKTNPITDISKEASVSDKYP